MAHWFKLHSSGFGATPANWKGWLFTGLFIAATIASSVAFFVYKSDLSATTIAVWLGIVTVLELLFLYVAWKKTDEPWRLPLRNQTKQER